MVGLASDVGREQQDIHLTPLKRESLKSFL